MKEGQNDLHYITDESERKRLRDLKSEFEPDGREEYPWQEECL